MSTLKTLATFQQIWWTHKVKCDHKSWTMWVKFNHYVTFSILDAGNCFFLTSWKFKSKLILLYCFGKCACAAWLKHSSDMKKSIADRKRFYFSVFHNSTSSKHYREMGHVWGSQRTWVRCFKPVRSVQSGSPCGWLTLWSIKWLHPPSREKVPSVLPSED